MASILDTLSCSSLRDCQILHYELLFAEALVARNDTTGRQPGHLRPANSHMVSLEADPPLIKS